MSFTGAELKKLALPVLACLAFIAAGAALLEVAGRSVRQASQRLAAVQAERSKNAERLARIAEEEREVKEKLAVYQRLKQLNILGDERRLEWADAMARIRAQRELLDLRYRVERQNLLVSLPGKPGSVDFHSSTMRVELALLHEGDLLRFLSDLRSSGNAYYSVKHCAISRSQGVPAGATIAPRLHATCDIDLVTIEDGGAKQ